MASHIRTRSTMSGSFNPSPKKWRCWRQRCQWIVACACALVVVHTYLPSQDGASNVNQWLRGSADALEYLRKSTPAEWSVDLSEDEVTQSPELEEKQEIYGIVEETYTPQRSRPPRRSQQVAMSSNAESTRNKSDYELNAQLPLDYREISSISTRSRECMPILFPGTEVTNPSIIPHPTEYNRWIVTAQRKHTSSYEEREETLACTAGFFGDTLLCFDQYTVLPTSPPPYGMCRPEHEEYNNHIGPNDLRVFYGPETPFLTYGSQSRHTCMNVWIQDARQLLSAFKTESFTRNPFFHSATELERPQPWQAIERNHFLFWDFAGNTYVHSNLWPRVFGKLDYDGSFRENLAPLSVESDVVCAAKFLPSVLQPHEALQQATNSLSVTLCLRDDKDCVADESNTFILHIFHHKALYDGHAVYEPYVVLFDQSPPFAMRAVGQRPLWIRGRGMLTAESPSVEYWGRETSDIPSGHPEKFYLTSISWGKARLKYHGYMDDPLFLAFGIEDAGAGVIDVLADELLQDLAFC